MSIFYKRRLWERIRKCKRLADNFPWSGEMFSLKRKESSLLPSFRPLESTIATACKWIVNMKTKPIKHTVLWADDDADDLLLMREVLKHLNNEHVIVEAYNGQEVLNYLDHITESSDLPCLIILDINMPVLNGRDTLALLKENKRYSSIPVVVFTTSSSELDRIFCQKMGVELFTKPPLYESLKNTMQRLLSYCRICE